MHDKHKAEQRKTEQTDSPHRPATGRPADTTGADQLKQKAEKSEVAGRHKNDGQKDHKGAR